MSKKLFILSLMLCLFCGCGKEPAPGSGSESEETIKDRPAYFRNYFGFSMMDTFYLWKYEVKEGLDNWTVSEDPVRKVHSLRYKDPVTNAEVDHWTMLTDDYSALNRQVTGNSSSTYGYDFYLLYYDAGRKRVVALVTYVYSGSPAEKAGLRRGDVILEVNGEIIPSDDSALSRIVSEDMLLSKTCTLTLDRNEELTMQAVAMYEDPVLLYKTFECSGKKVGYLHYTGFTDASCERLVEACRYFKAEGVKELILDLRYNGGGYVNTEELLMSMLAPESAVREKKVFAREVFNRDLAGRDDWGPGETRFSTSFEYVGPDNQTHRISTSDANIGISKLYALVSNRSASASESLITCLRPFIDVEIIGAQTAGKYCAGIIYPGLTWFDAVKDQMEEATEADRKYLDNWAIYVMISRYADCNGNTPCMPDGFVPDIECEDNPRDGYQLGDPRETMLAAALKRAGYVSAPKAAPALRIAARTYGEALPDNIHRPLPFVRAQSGQVQIPAFFPHPGRL